MTEIVLAQHARSAAAHYRAHDRCETATGHGGPCMPRSLARWPLRWTSQPVGRYLSSAPYPAGGPQPNKVESTMDDC